MDGLITGVGFTVGWAILKQDGKASGNHDRRTRCGGRLRPIRRRVVFALTTFLILRCSRPIKDTAQNEQSPTPRLRVAAERDCHRLFLRRQYCRARGFGTHRRVLPEVPPAPLAHGRAVQSVLLCFSIKPLPVAERRGPYHLTDDTAARLTVPAVLMRR